MRRRGGAAAADAVGLVEGAVDLEADLRRIAQLRLLADAGAEPRRGAAHGGEQARLVLAAQRHHEGGGVAQVGADIDRSDGDRGAAQLGIAHLAALQKLGEQMAQFLADPELALARPLLVALGRATTGHCLLFSSLREHGEPREAGGGVMTPPSP